MRDRLRTATADVHAALEARLDLASRLRTRDDLARVLARFLGFFRPLEAALDAHLGAAVMEGRHRTPSLERDLQALGFAAPVALPACPEAGRLDTVSQAWGALYVAEGARLGGRLIARDLARRGIAHDLHFWTDRAETVPSWPGFLRDLETVPDPALAEHGARATFGRLHDWMAADA